MRSDGDDDLTPLFERAFRQRSLALSDSGRYLAEQDDAQQQARVAESEREAREWVRAQGMGDMLPAPADYDYAAMLRDGVYPSKDGSGRIPLPPAYWRPGRMILGGVDVATGRRVTSSVPLEERILSGQDSAGGDGDPDVQELLASLSQEDLSELSSRERRSLEAWYDAHGIVLAQGGTQGTASDAPPAAAGTVRGRGQQGAPQVSDLAGLAQPAQALWDLLAGGLKGYTAQALGLPGDIESLVRMLTGTQDGQHMLTTEDVAAILPDVVPGGSDPSRQHSADLGRQAGELVMIGKADVAGKAVAKAAKVLAPAVERNAGAVAAGAGAAAVAGDSAKDKR